MITGRQLKDYTSGGQNDQKTGWTAVTTSKKTMKSLTETVHLLKRW